MRGFRNVTYALLISLATPVLIWVGAGSALLHSRKESEQLKKAIPNLVCSIDTDCPPGFMCVNGRCVPVKA
jgi:uncharacterized protein (DUF927 family)